MSFSTRRQGRTFPFVLVVLSLILCIDGFSSTPRMKSSIDSPKKKAEVRGMERKRLGRSDLELSKVGIGTLSFGHMTNEVNSHRLLDIAFDECGINYVDVSESYPKPSMPNTFGAAERIVGSWLKKRDRSSVIVASNVCGRSNYLDWLRNDGSCTELTESQIFEAVDSSLNRLGTTYVDLLQIEWPDRYAGEIGDDVYDYEKECDAVSFESQLRSLKKLVDDGKVRYIGLANETPYGIMRFCQAAKKYDLPMIVSVQNELNLICRYRMELGVIETCSEKNYNVDIIANTPLGGGALTGKYIDQWMYGVDEGARLNRFHGFQVRYKNKRCEDALKEYQTLLDKYNLSLTEVALQWVYSRHYVTSTLIGVTTEDQLRENVRALDTKIPPEVTDGIQKIYTKHRDPTVGPIIV